MPMPEAHLAHEGESVLILLSPKEAVQLSSLLGRHAEMHDLYNVLEDLVWSEGLVDREK